MVSDILDNGTNCVITADHNRYILVGTASRLTLADARLIAAAPDLLAVARRAEAVLTALSKAGIVKSETVRQALSEAIAKATGTAP